MSSTSPSFRSHNPPTTEAAVKGPRRSSSSPSLPTKDRLSTHSAASLTSQGQRLSRPGSHIFAAFPSSLTYALVRDFAYPSPDPLHYGPYPAESEPTTPVSEQRLSDPPILSSSWDNSRHHWSTGSWNTDSSGQQLPAMSFGDGPPYTEDEDLHSPVVKPRHRRYKSTGNELYGRRNKGRMARGSGSPYRNQPVDRGSRGTLITINPDGTETTVYLEEEEGDDGDGDDEEAAAAAGKDVGGGREFMTTTTYPANEGRYSSRMAYEQQQQRQQEQRGHGDDEGVVFDSDDEYYYEDENNYYDDGRYSRDYQFAVGCPDEEMHGKAVALFDFTREHENELPLCEGQVVYVSYRQSHGWLVAEDPKTGESGLVPEEFVRLLRDIQGGLSSLNGVEEVPNSSVAGGGGGGPSDLDEDNNNNTYLSPESTDDLGQGLSSDQDPAAKDQQSQSRREEEQQQR